MSPFLKLRTPRPDSVKFVTDFARRTGDLQVLSKPDIHLLALTYDLEVERNGGDWRLRREPNQKQVNGKSPGQGDAEASGPVEQTEQEAAAPSSEGPVSQETEDQTAPSTQSSAEAGHSSDQTTDDALAQQIRDLNLEATVAQDGNNSAEEEDDLTEEDDDGEGEWISMFSVVETPPGPMTDHSTAPSNIKKYQARENAHVEPQPVQKVLQAALITGDMAMRNVALRINLK